MEVVWKVVMMITNCHFTTSITFHDVLHGLKVGSGTGTDSLDAKLIQQLTATREEVFYEIFMDLHKAYDALDREI